MGSCPSRFATVGFIDSRVKELAEFEKALEKFFTFALYKKATCMANYNYHENSF